MAKKSIISGPIRAVVGELESIDACRTAVSFPQNFPFPHFLSHSLIFSLSLSLTLNLLYVVVARENQHETKLDQKKLLCFSLAQ
jgi:hypothetical protein